MTKQVIAYLHTHWDREWYREYEIFRMRLLRVFDNVLDMLETNRIPCFYFDGQVSALEDYLEIRPEKESLVKELIRLKKLYIGPFYCLVDEFLTDRTCFEKNLELGMTKAIEYGCTDFIGYLADTFGHSKNIPELLREFGIDKCIVWRGCEDKIPSEFSWFGMDTVNLVRGYFQDIFSSKIDLEQKAEFIKKELDKISEKSGDYLLLPIGADHLGVEKDIVDQILGINEILKDDYIIRLSSPFEYFKLVQENFGQFEYNDELRDNSRTFTLQGCYSARLDLKKLNVECTHKLDLASRFVRFTKNESRYENLLNYAYKLLIRNQAHDGICGCSTDDVHKENKIRYMKVLQIAETIIDELKFENNFDEKRIVNLDNKKYTGIVEVKTSQFLQGFEQVASKNGFDRYLLTDTQRIPVTEDYTTIKTYVAKINNLKPDDIDFLIPTPEDTDLEVSDNYIRNSKISLEIKNGEILINEIPFNLIDYVDNGDSYNNGPIIDDNGSKYRILRSKAILKGQMRVSLKIDLEGIRDIVSITVTLDNQSNYLKFNFDWTNTQKNHLLEAEFSLPCPIKTVLSEDMNTLIKRKFEPNYNIRENLPNERGIEAKTNTAPMQRGLLIDETNNNIGIITKGLTQYEVSQSRLLVPILRSIGVISNPKNPARSTPAGPPIETPDGQMIGNNSAEFYVFFGNRKTFKDTLRVIYNYIIV